MPAGDRTGPWGVGPRTGRGLGYCSGYGAPGYLYFGSGWGSGWGSGRGYGRGMGLGRGFRRFGFGRYWGYPSVPAAPYGTGYPPVREDEASWLADQAKGLEQQLQQIRTRLTELEKDKAREKK
ncbi:MAG: DUF5320 domain-containing protein [Candidatus Aminicenantes bacterium]|nr:DUF5320 domain-containing protein [Candidatus Aminicenantes bacterium]